MKIIFLASSLGAGGAERVATTLCNAWAERGDQVILVPTFSGGGRPFYEVSNDLKLVYLEKVVGSASKSPFNYFLRLSELRRLIATEKPDVVISFLPNVNVAAILATIFNLAPVICCERRDPSSQRANRFWELACRISYRFADMMVVQTDAVSKSIAQIYPGIKRIRSVPNPLPNEILQSGKNEKIRDRHTLLSIGRLSGEKQVDKIVSAFSKVARDFPAWDLHIYGDGDARSVIEEHIQNFNLGDRVFIFGNTASPWSVMNDADVFVMASKYEGFPNALLEAMGVGLPCVVFDCPSGPKDITANGKDAFMVSLDDQGAFEAALRQLMSNHVLREHLGKQARASILARYSLASVLSKWDDLFREVGVQI